jgi:DNA-binding CsgD family transcriptional regulator
MSGTREEFYAGVEKAHQAAHRHRTRVDEIRRHARENPELLAARIVEVVPQQMLESQVIAAKEFELNLTNAEDIRSFEAQSVAEWQLVCWLANRHQIYGACLSLIERYVEEPNLTGTRFARAVCEAFLEATERFLYTVALDFEWLRRNLPDQDFPAEELAKILTGITATRTSLHRNKRLRAAIDELRAHSRQKAAKRERFEQLLVDLPAEVLGAWDRASHPLSNLAAIRTEAVRKLEQWTNPEKSASSQEVELASFADREKLLKQAKSAGLSPQELEVFKLMISNPKMKYREIAAQLHIKSTNQVGVIKHRIRRKLDAAGF